MSATHVDQAAVRLEHRFASELPELALPWQAEEAPEPRLLALDEAVAAEVGLDPAYLRTDEGLRLLVGTHVPEGAQPVAQAYAGHQFGGWSPRLGDGRALLMGELVGPDGALRDLHLKGSGRTPFARGGDGLAGTAQMLRELVVSQAVHALGIPTTRALAVVATGRGVRRESVLPGAVLARVASSHLRVGTMQYARALVDGVEGTDPRLLARLVDVAIARHAPHLQTVGPDAGQRHLALFETVVAAQASLVARWMLVGFVHGVLNTDNVLLSGETIDYGPCAFMEAYDPATVFSSIDEAGRYSYGNQPAVLEWDLARLAEAMLPLFADDQDEAVEIATAALAGFRPAHAEAWSTGLAAKLGVPTGDHLEPLVADLLELLRDNRVDWTTFFRLLAGAARGDAEPVRGVFLDLAGFDAWAGRWRALSPDADAMDRVNPVYVPRNHLVEEALTAGTLGDLAPVEQLLEAVTRPFDERPGLERYAAPGPGGTYTTYCGT